jgi:hypothetical protein
MMRAIVPTNEVGSMQQERRKIDGREQNNFKREFCYKKQGFLN